MQNPYINHVWFNYLNNYLVTRKSVCLQGKRGAQHTLKSIQEKMKPIVVKLGAWAIQLLEPKCHNRPTTHIPSPFSIKDKTHSHTALSLASHFPKPKNLSNQQRERNVAVDSESRNSNKLKTKTPAMDSQTLSNPNTNAATFLSSQLLIEDSQADGGQAQEV